MIRTERLSKVIGRQTVLSDITLTVETSEAVELSGPPGSGKSTLLQILATLTKPTSGRVELAGIDVTARPFDARKKVFLAGGIGLGCREMTVLEYLRLIVAARARGRRANASEGARLIARIGLDATKRMATLSATEERQVSIAASIASGAEVLLFDEPLTGLEAPAIDCSAALIAEARARGAAILATASVDAPPSPLWNRHVRLDTVGA